METKCFLLSYILYPYMKNLCIKKTLPACTVSCQVEEYVEF